MKGITKTKKIITVAFLALSSFAAALVSATPVSAAEESAERIWMRGTNASVVNPITDLIQTKDGGWLKSGTVPSCTGQDNCTRLVKYNSGGMYEETLGSSSLFGTFRSVVESQDGGTYFAITRGEDGQPTIQKFAKVNGAYANTTWIAPSNIEYDNETYQNIYLLDILLDDDGNYVVYGLMSRDPFVQVEAQNHFVHFFFKIADIPTCNTADFFSSCTDLIWSVVDNPQTDSVNVNDLGMQKLTLDDSGEYTALDSRGGNDDTSIIKVKEASDHLSASIEWKAVSDGNRYFYEIKSLGNDSYIVREHTGIAKISKRLHAQTGEPILFIDWRVDLWSEQPYAEEGAHGLDVDSDGFTRITYRKREETRHIADLANYNQDSQNYLAKIDNTGNLVYIARLPEAGNAPTSAVVINSDKTITVAQFDSLSRFRESMIYDIAFHNNNTSDMPEGYTVPETVKAWRNTSVQVAQQDFPGWTFNGWYEQPDLSGTQITNSLSAQKDTDLYSIYTRKHYTLVFHMGDDTEGDDVTYGDQIPAPDAPEGYSVEGWYYDSGFNNPADLTDPDTILQCDNQAVCNFYAKIVPAVYQVNFHITSTDNPLYDLNTPVSVAHGDTVSDPGLASAYGYKFSGWYTDDSFAPSKAYAFTTPVTSNLDLYARFNRSGIKVDQDGIHCSVEISVEQCNNMYNENTKTITLTDDYDGGPIDIENVSGKYTIDVNGGATIDSGFGYAIRAYNSNNIDIEITDGTGSGGALNIAVSEQDAPNSECGAIHNNYGNTIINNVTLNIVDEVSGAAGICGTKVTVKGEDSVVNIDSYIGIYAYDGGVNLENGEVNLDVERHGIYSYAPINIKDADLEVVDDDISDGDYALKSERVIKIDGDNTINAEGLVNTDIFILNKGVFNLDGMLEADLFNQNGGELNIKDESGSFQGAIAGNFVVFNGGTAEIESADLGIQILDYISENDKARLEEEARQYGAVMPKDGVLEFNGGDATISGEVATVLIVKPVISPDDVIVDPEDQTTIGENMIVDPDFAELKSTKVNLGGETFVTTFSNGNDISVDVQTMTITNALKTVHIYAKPIPPVPATDEEDVPNTLDFQLIGLAGGVFIALMVEGMIIADLYRRLHGYEEEINQLS